LIDDLACRFESKKDLDQAIYIIRKFAEEFNLRIQPKNQEFFLYKSAKLKNTKLNYKKWIYREIPLCKKYKFLWTFFDHKLKFIENFNIIINKCWTLQANLSIVTQHMAMDQRIFIFRIFFKSIFNFAILPFHYTSKNQRIR